LCQELIDACKNVKVKGGNFENLTKLLKKEAAASNFNIALAAIKSGSALAEGAKTGFAAGAKDMIGAILLKYKEKKPSVLLEVDKFMDLTL